MEKKTLYLMHIFIIVLPFCCCMQRHRRQILQYLAAVTYMITYIQSASMSEATQRLDSIIQQNSDTDKMIRRFKIVHIESVYRNIY